MKIRKYIEDEQIIAEYERTELLAKLLNYEVKHVGSSDVFFDLGAKQYLLFHKNKYRGQLILKQYYQQVGEYEYICKGNTTQGMIEVLKKLQELL